MASGGFFRGTSLEQDSRYFNQNKKLLAKMAFPACFDERVDLTKVKLEVIHQWVTERVTELLGFEDDIVASLVVNLLEPKVDEKLDPRQLQLAITGFLEKDAAAFTQELWELLLSAQTHTTGIPAQLLEKKKKELEQIAREKEALRHVLETKRAAAASAPVADSSASVAKSELALPPSAPSVAKSKPAAAFSASIAKSESALSPRPEPITKSVAAQSPPVAKSQSTTAPSSPSLAVIISIGVEIGVK